MSEPTPTFAGEVQFRRYSDTSTQGTQIVLALSDREALQSFIGLEGKRFMAVLVQIGDDEKPVDPRNSRDVPNAGKSHIQREPLGDLCWRAVQWCREQEFADFISQAYYHAFPGGEPCTPVVPNDGSQEVFAKFAVQRLCGIESRKELDTNPEAARKFNQLIRGPYQKHLMARGIAR